MLTIERGGSGYDRYWSVDYGRGMAIHSWLIVALVKAWWRDRQQSGLHGR